MVDTQRIDQHDQTVDAAIAAVAAVITEYWDSVKTQLNSLFDQPTTLGAARAVLTQQLPNSANLITPVLDDQFSMLELPTPVRDINSGLATSAWNAVEQNNSAAFETLIAAIALSIIAGTPSATARASSLELADSLLASVTRQIQDVVVTTDAAYGIYIMRDAGVERFVYAGGTVSNTREFCRAHNNKTYSEAEIRKIWSSQTWGGKRPGDPFVTRGGYNCRHYWVPA